MESVSRAREPRRRRLNSLPTVISETSVSYNKSKQGSKERRRQRSSTQDLPVKWTANYEPRLCANLTNEEIAKAKATFFQADADHNGSLDVKELGTLLRLHLGLNPTDEMIENMVKAADSAENGGDGNGTLDLREFLTFYAKGLSNSRDGGYEDVLDAFKAMRKEGSSSNPSSPGSGDSLGKGDSLDSEFVKKDALANFMREQFELNIDVDSVFGLPPNTVDLPFQDFKTMMLMKDKGRD